MRDTRDIKDIGRRISDIDNAFERGLCHTLYQSGEQRRRRFFVSLLLGVKHGLRGLLFSWPLYLIALASFAISSSLAWLLLLFFIPAVGISGMILLKGIREDYGHYVQGVLLKPDAARQLLFRY